MNNKLTPGNIKMVGMPVSLHAQLKAEAKRQNMTIYELIEALADKADLYDKIMALGHTGDNLAIAQRTPPQRQEAQP